MDIPQQRGSAAPTVLTSRFTPLDLELRQPSSEGAPHLHPPTSRFYCSYSLPERSDHPPQRSHAAQRRSKPCVPVRPALITSHCYQFTLIRTKFRCTDPAPFTPGCVCVCVLLEVDVLVPIEILYRCVQRSCQFTLVTLRGGVICGCKRKCGVSSVKSLHNGSLSAHCCADKRSRRTRLLGPHSVQL